MRAYGHHIDGTMFAVMIGSKCRQVTRVQVQSSSAESALPVLIFFLGICLYGASCQLQHLRCAAAFEATVFDFNLLTLYLRLNSLLYEVIQ